ncbi:diacylglycerol kinase (ISS) [Dorcoceras hygrometricum]|uniref:Diacylglycerol kinase (ISS) n=1 Tax=Dorcoceras hygrometricum TaxID=472368 RepID=A0A2Z7AIN3_9LAMI|nr:diacylglycerol kinase (ISS) [Dorcoceras hygrometricum]
MIERLRDKQIKLEQRRTEQIISDKTSSMHLIEKTWRYPNWNSKGMSKLEQLKISTLEQCADARVVTTEEIQSAGITKLVHQPCTGAVP